MESTSLISKRAVRAHFLKISRVKRGGKFTRVSEDTIELTNAEAESAIRRIVTGQTDHLIPTDEDLLTKDPVRERALYAKFRERLNTYLASFMERRVYLERTGKTL